MLDRRTRTQLSRFIVVGLLATVVDASTYAGLLAAEVPGAHATAKGVAFLLGTTVAFLLNKAWTFEAKGSGATETRRFVVLYGATLVVNVGMNQATLITLTSTGLPLGWAEPTGFVVATACSTVLNFIGQKLWVFREANTA